MEDFAAQKSDWVEPISTTYRGLTLCELPPNNQGLTALILLNILEGIDLTTMRTDPVRYYHTLIEATKMRSPIATATSPIRLLEGPGEELLSKDYAAKRRALIDPDKAIDAPACGDRSWAATPPISASSTKIAMRSRSSTASSTPSDRRWLPATPASCCTTAAASSRSSRSSQPVRAEASVPHLDSRDGVQGWRFADVGGVMGGDVQAQGHVQVLVNLIDRRLNLQQAIDARACATSAGAV